MPVLPNGSISRTLHVEEPLFNGSLNPSFLTVTLRRSRDTSLSSTVTLSALDQTARNGQDFLFQATNITFPAGSTSMSLTVPILANHLRQTHSTFTLELSALLGDSSPSVIGPLNSIEVVIINRVLEGPYFPGLPQLDNFEDRTRCYSGGQFHDLALVCITVSLRGNERCIEMPL